jgi:ribonuclease R
VFKRAAAGYGFVRPQDVTTRTREHDVYVAAHHSLDAASGDLVRVELSRRSKRDEARRRGQIVEVLQRETYQFVGTYLERDGVGLVQVDGRVFSQPIPVGDPGAKNAQEGDQVVLEMVHFPRHFNAGEAVITEVMGRRGAPGVDTLSIIREYDLPDEYPESALQDARQQAEQFDESLEGRRDLTGATIITIDPQDARDFDDAISLDRIDNGHWLLGVHIADVAHFVPRDSHLDIEARRRGTSVYLPDRVIPMLPEIISNNLASLQPNRVRYTRSVFIEYTAEGIPVSVDVDCTAIKSKHRFNYDEVDDLLKQPEPWKKQLDQEVFALVLRMRELAMLLRERRLTAGAIELTLPEVKILLNPDGEVSGARLIPNTVSHQIIEEFMLAANQAVAETLHSRDMLFLRRIHEPPTTVKLRSLTDFVRHLGVPCQSLESRFEIKRVIAAVRTEPTEHAVNYAVLRSLQKAVYGPQISGHYALNWDHYCHFTSPIRRYPDLEIHRMFDAIERGKRPRSSKGELRRLGEHCSEREQRAEQAERELVRLKLLIYLSQRIGLQMRAVITGVEEFGLFAEGVELPAEGFIAISSLQDDFYRFEAATHSLTGQRSSNQFRLGDSLTVEVAHVDLARRELDFRLVQHAVAPHAPSGAKRATAVGRSTPKKGKRAARKNKARRRR